MEPDSHDSSSVRRRRRIGRTMREKTPDPSARHSKYSDDSSQLDTATTASEEITAATQTVRMQIRPPGHTMSAHESKILRRRDKTFASTAARSHSQPREAERLTSPEANDLIRTVKRSLSSPRHKDESSECERDSTIGSGAGGGGSVIEPLTPPISTADENLSRLEQNLRRFETERKRFESEKRTFEREKREHKLRYKQLNDSDERKRILTNYRKLSDRIQLPTDADERRRLLHSLRLQRNDVPTTAATARIRQRHSGYDESSTQFSSSDADMDENTAQRLSKQLSPVRRHASAMGNYVAGVRGPPPPPPKAPERRAASRNNSLSPIRPQRRSRTPEQRAEIVRKMEGEISTTKTTTTLTANIALDRSQSLHEAKPREKAHKQSHESLDSAGIRRRRSLEHETKRKKSLETHEHAHAPDEFITVLRHAAHPDITQVETIFDESAHHPKATFMQKLFGFFKRSSDVHKLHIVKETAHLLLVEENAVEIPQKVISKAFLRHSLRDARCVWRHLKSDYPLQVREIRRLRNKCIVNGILLILLCGFGGLMFRYTEGTSEDIYKCEVRKVKRDFIDNLWTVSHNMREDDWKSLARQKLRKFEDELHELQELGVRRYPGQHSWNFVNCILYCWTVVTTIGYGHITPKTTLGRTLSIVYAIIGIPIFLIILADFGKLFTRGMKFIWAYVRRLYYTGTCRQIRKQQQVRDAMMGLTSVYDMAVRRPSHFFGMGPDSDIESQASDPNKSLGASHPDTPTSPYPETYEIDDEFNLPVSVASVLLISYILCGTIVYKFWEDWTYFESFYFVFISMSTIGFGDFVPAHPIFMMCSIIYLVFGLALTSMFINVVQIKLSDTFKQASAKLGATIGFASELGDMGEMGDEGGSQVKTPSSELPSVHGSRLGKIAEDENELAANQKQSRQLPLTSILRPARTISPVSRDGNGSNVSEFSSGPPPLYPKKQVTTDKGADAAAVAPEQEKKKKRRFF